MTSLSAVGSTAWAAILFQVLSACAVRAEESEPHGGVAEVCSSGVRNQDWDVDCSVACQHVANCRPAYQDSDLTHLTCHDCLGSCLAGVSLGGNDLLESTEEDRRSWTCAALVEGCSALDHNCDIF